MFSTLCLAQVVTIPLTLDEQLLTSILVESSFKGEGRSADIYGRQGDCTHVKLEDPHYRIENNLLRLEVALSIHGGTEMGENCLFPMAWSGYLVLVQKPVFTRSEFALSFKVVDSKLLGKNREPATIAGVLWDLVKTNVYGYLERAQVDLAPPVGHLQSFLKPLFKKEVQTETTAMLESLHRGNVYVQDEKLIVELVAEVGEVYQAEAEPVPFTPEQRAQIVELWERWDSFLVNFISLIAHGFLPPDDRQLLMDSLLESRYTFAAALEKPELEGDLVRLQFLEVWKNLSPLFRRRLQSQSPGNSLGFLAFLTAADALTMFDGMGPTFGIELSQQGLLMLAEMLSGHATPLPYLFAPDENLRKLFEMQPEGGGDVPLNDLQEIDLEPAKEPLSLFLNFFVSPAYAAESKAAPDYSEILKWQVPEEPYPDYIDKVRGVLDRAAGSIVSQQKIPASLDKMFMEMISAVAWQESCFRQFIVKNKKLTYLLSYNGSSVGLMQINQRIWRGLYDSNRLRWDINYNAVAGSEIVTLYLNRYALKDASWVKKDRSDLLARLVYSMYNGGPGEYKKFLQREKTGKHYKSDKLFAQKLEWVKNKDWQKVRLCLIGG
jgi:hypothetical protein